MTKPFNWRKPDQGVTPPMPAPESVQQKGKAGYQLITVWLPSSVSSVALGLDSWQPLSGIERITNDDRVFILGFCAALQLSDSQRLALMEQYAARYQSALKRAGDNPAKEGIAKRDANRWLGAGANGFVIRD